MKPTLNKGVNMIKTYHLQTLTCPSCIAKIEKAISSLTGVRGVEVLFNASKVRVDLTEATNSSEIKETIQNLGYKVLRES